MSTVTIHVGSNLDVLPYRLSPNSVDAIVTDPPYELGFMGNSWDASGIAYNVELWKQCLRVLKPGGHLLAFSGSRTYHRMTCAIEDAGFEVRDQIMWVYGSGFPKSLNVSKAIDKRGGVSADFILFRDAVKDAMTKHKISRSMLQSALGNFMLSHYLSNGSQPAIPNLKDYLIIKDTVKLGNEFDSLFSSEAEREVIGKHNGDMGGLGGDRLGSFAGNITAPATEAAKRWDGWGTALKPAHEPICVARKPLEGTVADNVMKWGTGAINVDGCRVGTEVETWPSSRSRPDGHNNIYTGKMRGQPSHTVSAGKAPAGRWPANLIHDGSQEVLELFPETGPSKESRRGDRTGVNTNFGGSDGVRGHNDLGGSAALFFYCPKASKKDRDDGCEGMEEKANDDWPQNLDGDDKRGASPRANNHPTVKPTDLMRYLCRLVTPPGGTVLDPFMGSGSTGRGAVLEGFDFIGVELSDEYAAIAKARIDAALRK